MASVLSAFEISARGLSIQRAKMNSIAQNLANAETTETKEGGPYKRKRVVVTEQPFKQEFHAALQKADTKLSRTHEGHRPGNIRKLSNRLELSSAEMEEVREDGFKLIYDPSHPSANEDGYVKMPDVEIINEMVDMMMASRAYEANTLAISSAKKMAKDALDI